MTSCIQNNTTIGLIVNTRKRYKQKNTIAFRLVRKLEVFIFYYFLYSQNNTTSGNFSNNYLPRGIDVLPS